MGGDRGLRSSLWSRREHGPQEKNDRYRRQDEAGTPFGITVDFETLGEKDAALLDTVTLRHRDSMKQERVKTNELLSLLLSRVQ